MKINIGGGLTRPEGFITIDIDVNANPDYIVDLEKDILPFEDNSVSEVRAYHIFEHIGPGYFHMLQELYRVCRHGGIIDIQVPHPRHDNFLHDPTHVRSITIEGMRMFSKKYNDYQTELYKSTTGLAYRYGVDFELVAFQMVPDHYYAEIIPQLPQYQLERLSREVNNFFVEIHIKLVVIK
jgi:SAM-dependent methyltransferase